MDKCHKAFLDALKDSGAINMFGASTSLVAEFPELTKKEANTILLNWMQTYEGE